MPAGGKQRRWQIKIFEDEATEGNLPTHSEVEQSDMGYGALRDCPGAPPGSGPGLRVHRGSGSGSAGGWPPLGYGRFRAGTAGRVRRTPFCTPFASLVMAS